MMKLKQKHLVVGMGQIGQPIFKILNDVYNVSSFDVMELDLSGRLHMGDGSLPEPFDVMHICFGYKAGEEEAFKQAVKAYQRRFLGSTGLTIIHSTVGIGVSKELGAVHSPIRGQHPHLESGIRTFVKFFGGERASEAAECFRRAGVRVRVYNKPEATELGKLSETTFYALMIEYVKALKRKCDKLGLSFAEVFSEPAQEYNKGWEKLGYPEYKMPLLVPLMMPQGGHCTIPNCDLWENEFTKLIKELNAT